MTQRRTPPPSGRARPGSTPPRSPGAPRAGYGVLAEGHGRHRVDVAHGIRRQLSLPGHRPAGRRAPHGPPGHRGAAERVAGTPHGSTPGRHPPRSRRSASAHPGPWPEPRWRRVRPTQGRPGRQLAGRQPASSDAVPHRGQPVRAEHLRRAAGPHPGLRRDGGRPGGPAQAAGGPGHPRHARPGAVLRRHGAGLERGARDRGRRPAGGVHLRHRQGEVRPRDLRRGGAGGGHEARPAAQHHGLRARG